MPPPGPERVPLANSLAVPTAGSAGGLPRSDPATKLRLTLEERRTLLLLFAAIGGATVVAFVSLVAISNAYNGYAPLPVTGGVAAGLTFFTAGVLAYLLGLRHGVDADHIAAIDNTTRKLLQEGKRPLTVGTWFSLGHSTIVFGMAIAVGLAAAAVNNVLPEIQQIGGLLGTIISGTFLYIIGAINLIIAIEVYRLFRRIRAGELDELRLEEHLQKRGFMNRYFGRLFNVVQKPRDIYPIGVLFGLGFDTASEIALLAIVGVLGLAGAPVYVILVLPLLFACGMVLVDTSDGATMRYAYGWAFNRPMRRVFYNLTITVISVLVAFVIGTAEFLQVIAQEFNLSGPFWSALGNLDLETLGYFIIATFLVSWGVATAYYRYKRLDDVQFGPPVQRDSAS